MKDSVRELERKGISAESEFTNVSWLTIVLGLVVLGLVVVSLQRPELTGEYPAIPVLMPPSAAGVAGIVVLLALSRLIQRFIPRVKGLSKQDLIVVYVMVMIGGVMASVGWTGLSVANIAALGSWVAEEPDNYLGLFEQMSELVTIKDDDAIIGFFLGSDTGVPWRVWIGPMVVWTLFATVLFWIMLCLITIVREHWTERERLTYPLVLPVVEIARHGSDISNRGSVWKQRAFWLGMIFPVVMQATWIINRHVPAFPGIPGGIRLDQYFNEQPWSAVKIWPGFRFDWSPTFIGIGYLISLEASFSIWFFYLLVTKVTPVVFASVGSLRLWEHNFKFEFQRGAFMGISLFCLWLVRTDVKNMIIHAIRGTDNRRNEIMAPRMAVIGGGVAVILLLLFTSFVLKMNVLHTFLFLVVFFGTILGFSRARAETGIPLHQPGMEFANTHYYSAFGSETLSIGTRYGIGVWFNPLVNGFFGLGLSSALDAYKLGDEAKVHRRQMTKILLLAFVFAILVGYVTSLPVIYEAGAFNLENFHVVHGRSTGWPSWKIAKDSLFVIGYAIGFVIAVLLMYLRSRFVWWPFNAVGFAIAINSHMWGIWSGFFIAWVIKVIIFRYFGAKTYKDGIPFFIGMIVGSVMMTVIDTLIGTIVALV